MYVLQFFTLANHACLHRIEILLLPHHYQSYSFKPCPFAFAKLIRNDSPTKRQSDAQENLPREKKKTASPHTPLPHPISSHLPFILNQSAKKKGGRTTSSSSSDIFAPFSLHPYPRLSSSSAALYTQKARQSGLVSFLMLGKRRKSRGEAKRRKWIGSEGKGKVMRSEAKGKRRERKEEKGRQYHNPPPPPTHHPRFHFPSKRRRGGGWLYSCPKI